MDIARLLTEHGYTIALVGALIEGELVVVLAGLAAHRGYLALPLVIAFGALGGFVQGQLCFWIGRRYGNRLFARFPRVRLIRARVDVLLRRRGPLAIAAVRVLYGLRVLGPVAIGMGGVPATTFAIANAAASALWSGAWAGAGYVAGDAISRYFDDIRRVERPVFLGVAIVALLVTILLRWRRHERHKKPLPDLAPRSVRAP